MPGRYLSVRRVVVVLAETAILIAAFAAATSIRLLDPGGHADEYQHIVSRGLVTAAVMQICLYYSDLYEEYAMRRRVEILLRFAQAFFFAILALSVVYYFIPSLKVGRGIFFIYLPLSLAGILAWRTAYMWTVGREALSDAVLILGTGSFGPLHRRGDPPADSSWLSSRRVPRGAAGRGWEADRRPFGHRND